MNTQNLQQLRTNQVEQYVSNAERILEKFSPSDSTNVESIVKIAQALIKFDLHQAHQLDENDYKTKTAQIVYTAFFDELGKISTNEKFN